MSTSDGRSSACTMSMVRVDARRLERVALLQQQHELLEQPADPLGVVARDGDLVAPDVDLDVAEGRLDKAQQLVALAEQADHQVVAGNADLDLRGCHVILLEGVAQEYRRAVLMAPPSTGGAVGPRLAARRLTGGLDAS